MVYFTGDVREPKHLKEIYTVMSSYGFPIKGTMHLASIIPFLGIPVARMRSEIRMNVPSERCHL